MPQKRKFKFTDRGVRSLGLPPPDSRSSCVEYTDLVESGLKVAVYKSGKKSFRFRYVWQRVKKFLTIGPFPSVNVDQARSIVREWKSIIASGKDPQHEKNNVLEVLTFEDFVRNQYLVYAKNELRSYKDVVSQCNRLFPEFGNLPLADISTAQIASLHLRLRGEISAITANRFLSRLAAIFTLAQEWGLVQKHPARGIRKFKEGGGRKRVLSDSERKAFVKALFEEWDCQQAKAIGLLMVMGLRKMEVLSMRWEHVCLETGQVFLPQTKSGQPRHAQLNSQAIKIIEELKDGHINGAFLFPSDSACGHLREIRRSFSRVLNRAGIENFRMHDLRRSFASLLINSGVSIYEVGDLLGHASVQTTQSAYAHLNFETLKAASEIAAVELEKAMSA